MKKEKLNKILELHQKWLNGEDGVERADLSDANLRGANLRGANLRCANLHTADLHTADLRCANLRSVNLSWANLRDADLCSADLRGANLCGANLCSADLRGANLCGANLCGANLCGADLDDDIISLDRIGSPKRKITYNMTKNMVWCAYFKGTFEEWTRRIEDTYPYKNNRYRKEYDAAVVYFKAIKEAYQKSKEERSVSAERL